MDKLEFIKIMSYKFLPVSKYSFKKNNTFNLGTCSTDSPKSVQK